MGEQPQEGSLDEARAMAKDAAGGVSGWFKRRGCLFWGIAAVVVLYLIGSQERGAEREARQAAAQGAPAAASDGKPVISVSADELRAQFSANEVSAKARYQGSRIKVSGVIDRITLDMGDDAVVWLKTGESYEWVSVNLDDSEKAAAMALVKGQKVEALCERVTEGLGTPLLMDCALVK